MFSSKQKPGIAAQQNTNKRLSHAFNKQESKEIASKAKRGQKQSKNSSMVESSKNQRGQRGHSINLDENDRDNSADSVSSSD